MPQAAKTRSKKPATAETGPAETEAPKSVPRKVINPAYVKAMQELESPLYDAAYMAGIVSDVLAEALEDGNRPSFCPDAIHLTSKQAEKYLFAIYHAEELIKSALDAFEASPPVYLMMVSADAGPLESAAQEWRAEKQAYGSASAGGDPPKAVEFAMHRRIDELEERIVATEATTPREAVAVLELAREELKDMNPGLALPAIEKALNVLKAIAA